jgi:beta-xylosidase
MRKATIIDGNKLPGYRTLEGPKFYKENGWYYVFAPAGGVEEGWQAVFRSRSIRGPYDVRTVMDQGATPINGPHQGAWVSAQDGKDWFLHFQDKGAYGRVVHLQPMRWADGWPVIGEDGPNRPAPASRCSSMPSRWPAARPGAADLRRIRRPRLGLQWQWNANSQAGWYSLAERPGYLRLATQPAPEADYVRSARRSCCRSCRRRPSS